MTIVRLKPSLAILSKKPPQPGSPFSQQARWNQSGFWTVASGCFPWKHSSFQQGLGHSLARETWTYNSLYRLALIWAIRLTTWLMLPFHILNFNVLKLHPVFLNCSFDLLWKCLNDSDFTVRKWCASVQDHRRVTLIARFLNSGIWLSKCSWKLPRSLSKFILHWTSDRDIV